MNCYSTIKINEVLYHKMAQWVKVHATIPDNIELDP